MTEYRFTAKPFCYTVFVSQDDDDDEDQIRNVEFISPRELSFQDITEIIKKNYKGREIQSVQYFITSTPVVVSSVIVDPQTTGYDCPK